MPWPADFLSFEAPCTLHTSLALRQAIWRKEDARWIVCGIPEVLYTDHGSDFTSRHLEQVSADLKMRLVFSLPGQPRGRGRIERFFATINEMLLCELDGYAPAGGAVRGKPTLTLAAFEARLRRFFLDVYQRRVCAETKMPPAALGSEWFLATYARLVGATRSAVDSGGQGAPGAGGWHSLPEPPLPLDHAGGLRWRNRDAALRSARYGRDSRLP